MGRLVNPTASTQPRSDTTCHGVRVLAQGLLPVRHLGTLACPRISLNDLRCLLVSPSHGLIREAGTAPDQCGARSARPSQMGRLLGTYYTLNAIPLPSFTHHQKASRSVPRSHDSRSVTFSSTQFMHALVHGEETLSLLESSQELVCNSPKLAL